MSSALIKKVMNIIPVGETHRTVNMMCANLSFSKCMPDCKKWSEKIQNSSVQDVLCRFCHIAKLQAME